MSNLENHMTRYEFWNIFVSSAIAIFTFLAVLVALFGKKIQNLIYKPDIKIDYIPSSERCFRKAAPIKDRVQDFSQFTPTERQYYRLKVFNDGKKTAKRVKILIDIYNENKEEMERFEPSSLRWVSSNQETIDIAIKEVVYVNLLSQVTNIETKKEDIPPNFFVIRFEIFNTIPRGIAFDREIRKYLIKIIVHGDNFEPKTCWFKFIPVKGNIFAPGKLEFLKE